MLINYCGRDLSRTPTRVINVIMCSKDDDIVKTKDSVSIDSTCMKCDRKAVAIARTKDPFCRECYDAYFTHRFRATFGKARIVRQGEKVLVAFSGGTSSRVLLKLIEEGLSEDVQKKLRFIPHIVYIDEGVVLGHTHQSRLDLSVDILLIACQTGFPVYYTRLEEIYGPKQVWCLSDLITSSDDSWSSKTIGKNKQSGECAISEDPGELSNTADPQEPLVSHSQLATNMSLENGCGFSRSSIAERLCHLPLVMEDIKKRITEVFNNMQSLTAKENLLITLRQQLLIEVASQLEINKVIVGDNASRLSVRLLGNVAQGRGGNLPLDVGFCDDRNDVMTLRPMREFPASEVSSYIGIHQLDTVSIEHMSSLTSEKTSIEQLTENFLSRLQANFPSTTSTIFRTGDKLKINQLTSSVQKCLLCQAPCEMSLDKDVFSHVAISSNSYDPKLWEGLCYGCRLTVNDTAAGGDLLSFLPSIKDNL